MSDVCDDSLIRPLWASVGLHALIVALMTVSWLWHTEQKVMAPPAMMKAALVYAPKSTMPQQRTQTEKTEKTKPKPEPPKPEPPKPEVVKPKEKPPEIKPVEKPSPVVVKPEPPKPEPKKPEPKKVEPKKAEPKVEPKKQPEKKVEPPKPDAKQAAKKQDAKSAKDSEKIRKDADENLEAELQNEEITRTGALSAEQLGKWVGLIADRVESNWNRPPNARQGMVVVLRIQLLPNGQVKDVQVVQSSKDTAFDLAAVAAVRKVETFKDITDKMKPEELKMFSDFDLKFDPQDLLM